MRAPLGEEETQKEQDGKSAHSKRRRERQTDRAIMMPSTPETSIDVL
jgi:hypothetical protein